MQQLQAVREEVTAAAEAAQKDADAAQKQVSHMLAWLPCIGKPAPLIPSSHKPRPGNKLFARQFCSHGSRLAIVSTFFTCHC